MNAPLNVAEVCALRSNLKVSDCSVDNSAPALMDKFPVTALALAACRVLYTSRESPETVALAEPLIATYGPESSPMAFRAIIKGCFDATDAFHPRLNNGLKPTSNAQGRPTKTVSGCSAFWMLKLPLPVGPVKDKSSTNEDSLPLIKP